MSKDEGTGFSLREVFGRILRLEVYDSADAVETGFDCAQAAGKRFEKPNAWAAAAVTAGTVGMTAAFAALAARRSAMACADVLPASLEKLARVGSEYMPEQVVHEEVVHEEVVHEEVVHKEKGPLKEWLANKADELHRFRKEHTLPL